MYITSQSRPVFFRRASALPELHLECWQPRPLHADVADQLCILDEEIREQDSG
ncbi:MAG: hypothetical protein HOC23_13985 [Halieaceae bacterium]|jgi:hypothetical protein|nr:hypothetical protein [Halieaceae bacterium]